MPRALFWPLVDVKVEQSSKNKIVFTAPGIVPKKSNRGECIWKKLGWGKKLHCIVLMEKSQEV